MLLVWLMLLLLLLLRVAAAVVAAAAAAVAVNVKVKACATGDAIAVDFGMPGWRARSSMLAEMWPWSWPKNWSSVWPREWANVAAVHLQLADVAAVAVAVALCAAAAAVECCGQHCYTTCSPDFAKIWKHLALIACAQQQCCCRSCCCCCCCYVASDGCCCCWCCSSAAADVAADADAAAGVAAAADVAAAAVAMLQPLLLNMQQKLLHSVRPQHTWLAGKPSQADPARPTSFCSSFWLTEMQRRRTGTFGPLRLPFAHAPAPATPAALLFPHFA